MTRSTTPFGERAKAAANPVGAALLNLMELKRSNLCVAVDVQSKKGLLHLANTLGPEICVLKTHIDIISDFDHSLLVDLQGLAAKHNFLIFEDRKFCDIGNTAREQYQGGVFRIASWAHLVNAHILPGPGVIEALKQVGLPRERGLLLLAEFSTKGSLATGDYSHKALEIGEQHPEFVCGFITQTVYSDNPGFVHMTPGIKLSAEGATFGQQYSTPDRVIGELGSDVGIVGRGITHAADPAQSAKQYRRVLWNAYQQRLEPMVNLAT